MSAEKKPGYDGASKEEIELSQRLDFYGLTPEICDTLKQNTDLISKVLPPALDIFYNHISTWPNVAAFFKSSTMMSEARKGQEKHWSRIASGQFDSKYYQSSLTIGKTHNRIGLDPRWYIGGYAILTSNLIMALINEIISNPWSVRKRKEDLKDLLNALIRGVFLDMDIAISTFLDAKDADFQMFLNRMTDQFDTDMAVFLQELNAGALSMTNCASTLSTLSHSGLEQAQSMAAASEESATSIHTVAAAAEELSASTSEINQQMSRTANIVRDAAEQARHARESIIGLKNSADKIDDVIKLITDITEQTNLLALNATIEAARAGEAGKGFAVVANEVKSLANESAKASLEISDLVKSIQQEVNITVGSIEKVAQTITQVEEIAASVSSAVEEQSTATQEIVRSAANAADGAKELSQIASHVTGNANQTTTEAETVKSAAQNVEDKSTQLREQLDVFLSNVKKI